MQARAETVNDGVGSITRAAYTMRAGAAPPMTSPTPLNRASAPHALAIPRPGVLATALAVLVFAGLTVRNAWMGDDPYITLRTVDNFVQGYGLTWNVDERVQSYTHPLWTMIMIVLYAVTREGYFTNLALCFACSTGVLLVAGRLFAATPLRVVLFAALLFSSKAYVDYSSSGLENPLTHLLVMVLIAVWLPAAEGRVPWTLRRVFSLMTLVSLAFLNRADSILFYVVPLAWTLVAAARLHRGRIVLPLLAGGAPAVAWLLFASLYYGFALPNTAYSKLNGGTFRPSLLHPNSVGYFANSVRWDPATLTLVATAMALTLLLTLRRRRAHGPFVALAAGVALYLVYVLRIGGDYMSGRFFSTPLVVSAFLIAQATVGARVQAIAAVATLGFIPLGPRSPYLASSTYVLLPADPSGIRDERGMYNEGMSLLRVIEKNDHPGTRNSGAGPPIRATRAPVIGWGAIGYAGFAVGPEVHIVDPIALPDALLARLPAEGVDARWGRGHLFRRFPPGYLQSLQTGDNLIQDPALHAYYEALRVILRGPLFTKERLRIIWRMNTGYYAPLLQEYAGRNPL